jgi:hypothetical protein
MGYLIPMLVISFSKKKEKFSQIPSHFPKYFHIQMVVLGNNPSAVMVFQRFIFSAKKFRGK